MCRNHDRNYRRISYSYAHNILPLFKTLHSCNIKLGKLVIMVLSCPCVAYLIDLSIHLNFNSRMVLEHRCFVFTLRILSTTCGLEAKYLEVDRVLVLIVLSLNQQVLSNNLYEKLLTSLSISQTIHTVNIINFVNVVFHAYHPSEFTCYKNVINICCI